MVIGVGGIEQRIRLGHDDGMFLGIYVALIPPERPDEVGGLAPTAIRGHQRGPRRPVQQTGDAILPLTLVVSYGPTPEVNHEAHALVAEAKLAPGLKPAVLILYHRSEHTDPEHAGLPAIGCLRDSGKHTQAMCHVSSRGIKGHLVVPPEPPEQPPRVVAPGHPRMVGDFRDGPTPVDAFEEALVRS